MGCLNLIWGEDTVQPDIAVLNQDDSNIAEFAMGALRSHDNINIKEVSTLDEGIDELRTGETEAFLVIPDDFGEKYDNISDENRSDSIVFDIYHTAGEQEEELLDMIIKGITSDINDFIEGEKQRPVVVSSRRLDLDVGSTSNMLLPVGVSVVLVHVGIYSSSSNASRFKDHELNKRLKASPKDPIYPVLGMITVDSLFTTLTGIIALLTGLFLFEISISMVAFFISIILFIFTSFILTSIGHTVGKTSDVQTSSNSTSSMIVFPLLFFNTAFLLSSIFPEDVTRIGRYLPTFPLAQGMKQLYFYQTPWSDIVFLLLASSFWLIVSFMMCYLLEKSRA